MRPRDLVGVSGSEKAERYLSESGFADPARALVLLDKLRSELGDDERLSDFLEATLPLVSSAADPDAGFLNLVSFFECFANPMSLAAFLLEGKEPAKVLIRILGASPYLSAILQRNPEYFYWLMEKGRLDGERDLSYFVSEAQAATSSFRDLENQLEGLRRFQRREHLHIATRDLLGLVSVEQSIIEISLLADAVISETLRSVSREIPAEGFAVLGMGKLGGLELNYSSDVDLVYVFKDDAQRDQVFLLARRLTKALSTHGQEGRLYRVDLRLRPMGRSGEIAYSIDSYNRFFETWGDTFDRLALIKARFVAGDVQLAEAFLERARQFVYRRHLDWAALEEIRWVKEQHEKRLDGAQQANIKLGSGGIREIEFFVQAFQLLYGAQNPLLMTTSTLQGLDSLQRLDFISSDDAESLGSAYRFLRRLEHKLQLVHDQQTHELPSEGTVLAQHARRMGYQATEMFSELEQFQQDLEKHRRAVELRYGAMFEERAPSQVFEILSLAETAPEKVVKLLKEQGIEPAQETQEGVRLLLSRPAYPQSPARLRSVLANLLPKLFSMGLPPESTRALYVRLDRLAESVGSRVAFLESLVENESLWVRVGELLSTSEYLSEVLIRRPELSDVLTQDPTLLEQSTQLERTESEADPPLELGAALGHYKQGEELKIALAALDLPHPFWARQRLTRLAEDCLGEAVRFAVEKHGLQDLPFVVLGLGKLGGEELTFFSDLDLVLVYSGAADQREALSKCFLEAKSILETLTPLGAVYRLDLRLRPEGSHGGFVSSLDSFVQYFQGRADPWEKLAYVKARPVFSQGDAFLWETCLRNLELSESVLEGLDKIRKRNENEIGKESGGTHLNFKVGRGGMMDIWFVLNVLQLAHGVFEPNGIKSLELLKERGVLSELSANVFEEGLDFLFRLESLKRLIEGDGSSVISAQPLENLVITQKLGYDKPEDFQEEYGHRTESIRDCYERVFEGGALKI